MNVRRAVLLSAAAGVLAAGAFVLGCSKSSNPTSPAGGGGGGAELGSGNIPPGGVFQHTFAAAGTFPYHCTIHAAMTGNQVVVSASASADSAFVQIVSMTAPGFSPASVTIKPGGHVRWVNAHTVPHTVTSGS
ncbi:MAG: hypothetical protein HZC42_02120 [Candidatus Eisenbacteria bacterium]|nr:hypothetical protein [Candidatus Eisenbacteria bacterium]